MDNGTRVALHRQVSAESQKQTGREHRRQSSMDSPRTGRATSRFLFGRQSSMDPNRRRGRSQSPVGRQPEPGVPGNLDATMRLLFLSCHGDAAGVDALLRGGVDVNSANLDGRNALHVAACEGHADVVRVLLSWQANVDARDRWGSTAVADAKCYGHTEVYNILKSHGAKIPWNRRTPMMVSRPGDIPEYELNPRELQFRKGDEVIRGTYQVGKWNGTKVSVKILDRESYFDQEAINSFRHELTVFEKVRHPNVLQFIGAVTQNIPMMIVSEYSDNGDLASYIQRKGRLHGQKVLRFALDIARGMTYLHQCKPDPIIHCDLKPKNVFLDNGGQLKVGGFGLMRLLKTTPGKVKLVNHESLVETFSYYTAPELLRNEDFDASVDAYGFGFILYEMVEGSPHTTRSPEEPSQSSRQGGAARPSLKNKLRGYPSNLRELVEECWDSNAMARPTFSEMIVRLDRIYSSCAKQGAWKHSLRIWRR